ADEEEEEAQQKRGEENQPKSTDDGPEHVYALYGAAALVVLLAGWTITASADAIASQTGLAQGFVGFTIVSIATSLPEISTTRSAAKAGRFVAATSNIFGS